MEKTCSKCKKSLPATTQYFYKRTKIAEGLASRCKECHKEHVNNKNIEYRQARIELKQSDLFTLTIDNIGEYVKKTGVKIMPGEAYNLYECGCLINHEDDIASFAYYPVLGYVNRTCPNHKPFAIVSKYKICGLCGTERYSTRVKASYKCANCYGVKNDKKIPDKILRNKKLGDPSRGDCKNRSECGWKYIEYAAIPCKKCARYEKEKLEQPRYKEDARQYGNNNLSKVCV